MSGLDDDMMKDDARETCQRKIKNTQFQTFAYFYKCGKVATHTCSGLPVCEHHYNKWKNKMQRKIARGEHVTDKLTDNELKDK